MISTVLHTHDKKWLVYALLKSAVTCKTVREADQELWTKMCFLTEVLHIDCGLF